MERADSGVLNYSNSVSFEMDMPHDGNYKDNASLDLYSIIMFDCHSSTALEISSSFNGFEMSNKEETLANRVQHEGV